MTNFDLPVDFMQCWSAQLRESVYDYLIDEEVQEVALFGGEDYPTAIKYNNIAFHRQFLYWSPKIANEFKNALTARLCRINAHSSPLTAEANPPAQPLILSTTLRDQDAI